MKQGATALTTILTAMVAVVAISCGTATLAQIRVGQTSSFTGPVASGVKEGTEGAKLYLDAVNARGGVNGQTIELIALDDKFDAKLAAENAGKLIDQGVVALFFNRGTPQSEAIMPVLAKRQVPLIAPSTGAMSLHEPVHPWVFNVRSTYQREAERAVQHLFTVGITRIALLQSDDSFGKDGATGALKGFAAVKAKPVVHESYSRAKPDYSALVPKVIQADAQAVVFIGAGTQLVDGVKALRAAGSRAQIVSLSNNASSGFIKALGEHARGVLVAQVFPNERSAVAPMIRELHALMKAKGLSGMPTPAMVEGFAAAKVLVEAVRRAGKDPTPSRIKAALETFRNYDLGGLEISFSANDHTGVEFSELSIITAEGNFRR